VKRRDRWQRTGAAHAVAALEAVGVAQPRAQRAIGQPFDRNPGALYENTLFVRAT